MEPSEVQVSEETYKNLAKEAFENLYFEAETFIIQAHKLRLELSTAYRRGYADAMNDRDKPK